MIRRRLAPEVFAELSRFVLGVLQAHRLSRGIQFGFAAAKGARDGEAAVRGGVWDDRTRAIEVRVWTAQEFLTNRPVTTFERGCDDPSAMNKNWRLVDTTPWLPTPGSG